MNKIILIGRLTADPEIRETQNGTPVARFTIAVDRRYKQEGGQQADFPVCIAWNKTAAFVADYFRKGKLIGIEGQLQTRSWEDNYGNRRYATEVVCNNVEFVGPKEQQSGGGYPYKGGNSPAGYQKPQQMKIDEYGLEEVSEDDLPF